MKIKQEYGWFPAGNEMLRAFESLSDGAFRLYFYLCLKASRATAKYSFSNPQLAKEVDRNKGSVRAYITEMSRKRVCEVIPGRNQYQCSEIRICESFWPYVVTERNQQCDQSEFLERVSKILRERACIKSRFSSLERDYATTLHFSGVGLCQIERAVHLACFRKYTSLLVHGKGELIASFLYFRDTIDELTSPDQPIHGELNDFYCQNVTKKMLLAEQQWIAQNQFKPPVRESKSVQGSR